jgi:hypothetical protein
VPTGQSIGFTDALPEERMKQLVVGLCFAVAAMPYTFAQETRKDSGEKSTKREPTEQQKATETRMKDCAAKAGDRKGDERKKFMSECLSKA